MPAAFNSSLSLPPVQRPRLDADSFGPVLPLCLHRSDTIRISTGQGVQLGAVGGQVVQRPRGAACSNQLPLSIANSGIALVLEKQSFRTREIPARQNGSQAPASNRRHVVPCVLSGIAHACQVGTSREQIDDMSHLPGD